MAAGEHRPAQVLDSYLLRSLSVAGYAPSFEPAPTAVWRARTAGSTRRWAGCCARPAGCPGSASPAPETITLLGALLAGDWPVVEAATPRQLTEASGLVAAYLQWHLERGTAVAGARRALMRRP